MWYFEFLTFILSQITAAAVMLPWALMLEQQTIKPSCTLIKNFQFKPWGSACGYTWESLGQFNDDKNFAYATVILDIRMASVAAAAVAQAMILFVIWVDMRKGVLTLGGLIVCTLSIIITTEYASEMDTTMTPPRHFVMCRGPGYLLQTVCAAYGGAIFFLEFYMTTPIEYKIENRDRHLRFWAYLLSTASVMSLFDEHYSPLIIVLILINVTSSVCIYMSLAFVGCRLVNVLCVAHVVADVIIIASVGDGWTLYTCTAAILLSLTILKIYNYDK